MAPQEMDSQEMDGRLIIFQPHNNHRRKVLWMYDVITIVVVVFFVCLVIFSSIMVKMVIKDGRISASANFDLYLNETHFDLKFLKSLPKKTEYKIPLRNTKLKDNNGETEPLNQSPFHLVSMASAHPPSVSPTMPPYQQANGTTFEPLRKWKLKVNNGGIDVPESLNQIPVRLVSLASVSPTPPPTLPPPAFRPPMPPLSTTAISPPLPPSVSQRQIQEQQLNNILEALIGAGDFMGWANLLSSTDPSSLPLTATFFFPRNDAMSNHQTLGVQSSLPSLIAYHIIPQRLHFSDLIQLKPNTRIPTLLPSKSIVVTNNSLSNFTIDGSQITHPDLYVNPAFTVHGVDKILEYSVYGTDPPVQSPPMADADAPNTTPLKPKSVFRGRGFIDGSDSNIPFAIEMLVFLCASILLLQ